MCDGRNTLKLKREVWTFYRVAFVANFIVNFVDRSGWIGPRRSGLEVAMFSHERLKVYVRKSPMVISHPIGQSLR